MSFLKKIFYKTDDCNSFFRSLQYQFIENLITCESMDQISNWMKYLNKNLQENDMINYISINKETKE